MSPYLMLQIRRPFQRCLQTIGLVFALSLATNLQDNKIFVDANLEGPFCGYAPLCGSQNQTLVLSNDLPSNFPVDVKDNLLLGGAVLEFQDCCSLTDTQPVRDCEIVNPSGSSERFITASAPLCDNDPNGCENGDCENYAIFLRPTFTSTDTQGCCDTCSCYGDPECRSFDGTHKMWLLCDGREVPEESDNWERCRITKEVCEAQTDHAGNQCTYLASNKNGKGWNTVKKGSPCVPNPLSPASVINMYSAANDNFKFELSQGERGIILSVKLTLQCGVFELSAVDCLTEGVSAWKYNTSAITSETYSTVFKRTSFVESEDILWDILDPDSGIAINLRCYGNKAETQDVNNYPGGVYVPRINVEALSDPLPNRQNTGGFCVTNDFEYGLSNGTERTNYIQDNKLCVDGLDNFTTLEVYREICENKALPQSGINTCVQNFCSKNFLPLYGNKNECISAMTTDLSTGFCKAMVFAESAVSECVEQWFDLGPVATIQQYLNDNSGCVAFEDLKTSPDNCEVGVTIQYFDSASSSWVDVLFIPENYCGDGSDGNGQIALTKCEHEELFVNRIRLVQGASGVNCAVQNQCTTISGFEGFIGLSIPPTGSPTASPSVFPTIFPSDYPTDFPSLSPTLYPTEFPTLSPSSAPTKFPSQYPTPFPIGSPTSYPTEFPSASPTLSPTVFPTTYPTEFPTTSPTSYPTTYPTVPQPNNETNPPCEYKLCETPEIFYPIDDTGMFHARMDSCCPISPQEACPQNEVEPTSLNRTQGSNMPYCGNKVPDTEPFKKSCKNNDKLQVKVMFMREEETVCCKSCTCYGDPRCLSFDNVFQEFILCDGRTEPVNNNTEERCVIRKSTCLEQKDHAGNVCTWTNANTEVPDFSDPIVQAEEEIKFDVARWGSPCRYNEALSPPSIVTLYKVQDFELKVQQEERGYIHEINITTNFGRYTIAAESCNSGRSFYTLEKYSTSEDFFEHVNFGVEDLWTMIDRTTNIEVSIRCTGVFDNGRIVLPFMNIEYINEPDEERALTGDGFCATSDFPERALSTWQHSQKLADHNYCMTWNLYSTPIILRNAARAIINYPGLSTLGTEWAYTDFCTQHFAPKFKSIEKCTQAFMNSKNVDDVINNFCKAVTLTSGPCVENIQMLADTEGYEKAFEQARIQYVETYNEICSVLRSSDLLDFVVDDNRCKQGVELQYQDPKKGWITYKAFPTKEAPCNGFMVEFKFKNDKPLFQYPIRVKQLYFPRQCSACEYISTVDAWFQFVPAS